MSSDILPIIDQFVIGLRAHRVDVSAINLASHQDGMKLVAEVHHTNLVYEPGKYGNPIEQPDGSVWMEMMIFGLKIRWPAMKYPQQGGGFTWG